MSKPLNLIKMLLTTCSRPIFSRIALQVRPVPLHLSPETFWGNLRCSTNRPGCLYCCPTNVTFRC